MSKVIERNGWRALRRFTPARIALGRAGHSLPTQELLQFGLAHAQARDAVHLQLDVDAVRAGLEGLGMQTLTVHSAASDRTQYLLRPDLGRRLAPASRDALAALRVQPAPELCVVIGDGLSASAVHRHAVPLLQCLLPLLAADGWTCTPAIVAQQSRVALADEVGELLQARVAVILIGERPGLSSPDSLGVYMTHDPRLGRVDAERNCISNIRPQGLAYRDAAHKLLFLLNAARRLGLSGVQLKDESDSVQTLGDERDRSGG